MIALMHTVIFLKTALSLSSTVIFSVSLQWHFRVIALMRNSYTMYMTSMKKVNITIVKFKYDTHPWGTLCDRSSQGLPTCQLVSETATHLDGSVSKMFTGYDVAHTTFMYNLPCAGVVYSLH